MCTKLFTVLYFLAQHNNGLSIRQAQLEPSCATFRTTLDSIIGIVFKECWLRVREDPGSIPSEGPLHTKDVIKMVPVVPLFSTEHSKGKYWLFLKN